MVAVPLTAFWTLPLGMAALALMPLHLEVLALVPMGWGVQAILAVGRFVSDWPQAVVAGPPLPGWGPAAGSPGRGRARAGGGPEAPGGWAAGFVRPGPPPLSPPPRLVRCPPG